MNKLAIITGASKGIGLAIVEKFAKNGFDIAICARNLTDLDALKTDLETKYKIQVFAKQVDVSVKVEVLAFGEFILSLNRNIDVLVNNAGVFLGGPMHSEADGVLENLIETNLYSAYHLTRVILPNMIANKKGYIFNICSVASIMAYPYGGSYSISKFALLGFSKSLREEMKPHNINVTSILPGATHTQSWNGVDLPKERFMQTADVADTLWAAYNLSPNAVIEEIIMRPTLGDI
jgi:short-subunit dehydrogenase